LLSLRPKRVVAVDIAPRMMQQAQRLIGCGGGVEWLVGDMELVSWAQEGAADLIVSNAVLHWVHDPVRILRKCHQTLALGGECVHTMMGPDTFQELKELFWQVETDMKLPPQQHHLPLASAAEWESFYHQAGFTQVKVVEYWHRVEYADCRAFLQAVQSMGESFSLAQQNLFTSYRVLLQVMQKYNLAYRSKTGVYATFHVIQCTAKKQ
jgi:malonyl-CoA O-methyltransferase